jgi:hypothetical protein
VLSVSPRLTYQAAGQALVATDHEASASRPCSLCTHHPRRKRGCRGFTGPVPPPLLMSARISDKPVCRQGLPERPPPGPALEGLSDAPASVGSATRFFGRFGPRGCSARIAEPVLSQLPDSYSSQGLGTAPKAGRPSDPSLSGCTGCSRVNEEGVSLPRESIRNRSGIDLEEFQPAGGVSAGVGKTWNGNAVPYPKGNTGHGS